jgi:RNA polymerase sigma factor (sigma-70 family)
MPMALTPAQSATMTMTTSGTAPAAVPAFATARPAARSAGNPVVADLLSRLTAQRRRFVAFARRRVASDADAEDIVQQGFARAAEKLDHMRDPDRVVAWFYRVLRRMIADQLARRALGARKLDELAVSLEQATPEERASCACALGLLDGLRPDYADILRRVDLEDESLEQAAAALGITPNNAGVRLHRARARLRADVQDLCGAPGAEAARRPCADCECA